MATEFVTKTLFGPPGKSYFRDRKDFCRELVDRVNEAAGRELLPGADPEAALRATPHTQLLELALSHGLDLDDLVRLELTEEEAQRYFDEGKKQGLTAVAGDGSDLSSTPGEKTAVVRMVLQVAALNEVCAPPAEWSADKAAFMTRARERLDALKPIS